MKHRRDISAFVLGMLTGFTAVYIYEKFHCKDAQIEDETSKPAPADSAVTKHDIEAARKVYDTITSEASSFPQKAPLADRPYVISPSEFGELENYEQCTLTFYADGVLTDSNDEEVDDVDSLIGRESLSHFGEYEDDSVFVRNDTTKMDYEILLDNRFYSNVIKAEPYLAIKNKEVPGTDIHEEED